MEGGEGLRREREGERLGGKRMGRGERRKREGGRGETNLDRHESQESFFVSSS